MISICLGLVGYSCGYCLLRHLYRGGARIRHRSVIIAHRSYKIHYRTKGLSPDNNYLIASGHPPDMVHVNLAACRH